MKWLTFYSVHRNTITPGRKQWMSGDLLHPPPSAYQPPTGQVLSHRRWGPQPTTSPPSQLSLDFSGQKALLSEKLRRVSDRAEELPETDPSVYLAAAWQAPIPTVEAVRATRTHQASPPPSLWLCGAGVTQDAFIVHIIVHIQVASKQLASSAVFFMQWWLFLAGPESSLRFEDLWSKQLENSSSCLRPEL